MKEVSRSRSKRTKKTLSWAEQGALQVPGRAVWLRHTFTTDSFRPADVRITAGRLSCAASCVWLKAAHSSQ